MREHQLSAILFTDIIGYSSQMAANEASTLDALKRNKENHRRIVQKYHGKVIDIIGDGHLCIFSSGLDAVYAGLALQQQLELSKDLTKLRVGVHVGDVVIERNGISGMRVIGDTVNTASRIESNAPGPGVWVSARVASGLRGHDHLSLESAGIFNLKNIPEPMEIFQVTTNTNELPQARPRTHFTYRQQHISKTMVFASALLVIAVSVGAFVASQMLDDPETLAILPLEYIGSDVTHQHIAPLLSAQLQNRLSSVTSVRLASQMNARRLTESDEYLGDEEVDYFMEGTLLLENTLATLQINIVEADGDIILYSHQWQSDLEQLNIMEQEALNEIEQFVEAEL